MSLKWDQARKREDKVWKNSIFNLRYLYEGLKSESPLSCINLRIRVLVHRNHDLETYLGAWTWSLVEISQYLGWNVLDGRTEQNLKHGVNKVLHVRVLPYLV